MPWSKDSPPAVAKNWSEEEQDKCIAAANSVLLDGGSDEEAIFACINAAGKSKTMAKIRSSEDGRVIYFEDAVLAVAEVNKNLDDISVNNLEELAASIPLQPLDEEHMAQRVVGMFTGGKVIDKEFLTDGCVFASRFPEIAQGILNKSKKLSLSADAETVICGTCGEEFTVMNQTRCSHLSASIQTRRENGWTKRYKGLTSDGGAVTDNPAGTGTEFNKIRLVASIETQFDTEDLMMLNKLDELLKRYGMGIRR